MNRRTKTIALDRVNLLRERVEELKSWLKENSQGTGDSLSNPATNSGDPHCSCGYLAALEDALSLLLDERESLFVSPNSDRDSDSYRMRMSDSEDSPALNGAARVADALPKDRRTRLGSRRRGERRMVGLEPGSQGRRRTDRLARKI